MIQVGDKFRSLLPFQVDVFLLVGAPVSLFGEGILPAGEIFTVIDPRLYGKVQCIPERYDALHDHFISQEERQKVNKAYYNQYEGYSLLVSADSIAINCERLPSDT